MPAIFRYKGYRFFFYSNEGYPREPLHVHIRKADAVAKIWLEPELSVASSYGMTSAELNELCRVAEDNKKLIQEYWNEHFGF
ncbi:DUF4160 domain-containing protein [Anaerohalosphaeraceae bacterium U12dextr]